MIHFFSPHFFICIALVAPVVVGSRILQIAPNFLDTNYELSASIANTLSTNGHSVHFLIPLSKPSSLQSSKDKLHQNSNLHVQICELSEKTLRWMDKPPADSNFINPPPENIQKGGWTARHFMQSPAIAYVEGFEVIADIFRQKNCWDELNEANSREPFTVGLMDIWDFGALALFHKLGITNVVLLHNFPIMSHMYDYMSEAGWSTENGEKLNYKAQILENGVPEVFSAIINDENIGKPEAFTEKHETSSNIFNTVYEKADQEFKQLFKNNNMPSLKELFGNAKYLFVNTIRSLDYNLGTLPKQVKFVGGIDLVQSHHEQHRDKFSKQKINLPENVMDVIREAKQVIVFSMSSLLDPAKMPDDKFETIVTGLGMLKDMTVIWKYDNKQFSNQENRHLLLKSVATNVHLVDDYDPSILIANKNTALVISECDIRSVLDALSVEKPLLCMPMFAEHFYVAEKLRREGAATVLDPRDSNFTSDAIAESIRECLHLSSSNAPNNPWKTHSFKMSSKNDLQTLILDTFAKIENV